MTGKIPHDMGYRSTTKDGPVGMALQWLRAALDCKAWNWDADQRECAEQSYKDATEWMKKLGEVPETGWHTHTLWETGEEGVPEVICDSNGEVVLGLCKVCGRGECELVEPCNAGDKK